jgi:hypothetical protein
MARRFRIEACRKEMNLRHVAGASRPCKQRRGATCVT